MNDINLQPARWWHLRAKGIQCDLCPRQCRLKDGERGFCFIRQNVDGSLKTLYGLTSGLAVDPIEKKPLYHFLPGSRILSFGLIGCNLGCQFCQNWQISKPSDFSRLTHCIAPGDIVGIAQKANCRSVAFTYNEPIISAEYVTDVAAECQAGAIKTVAVTAGYASEAARKDFFQFMDAANVDLKAFSDSFYKKFCQARLKPILDTLVFLKERTNVWLEITNLLIPDANDSAAEIQQMCHWIVKNLGADVPLHFSAFHPDYRLLDRTPTSRDVLLRARDIALSCGLRYVYTGNIDDVESAKTFCYNCGKILVERRGYKVLHINLEDGRCTFCHTPCDGVFA